MPEKEHSEKRTKLVDPRYQPPRPGVGPRPEYLRHLSKTVRLEELTEVEIE